MSTLKDKVESSQGPKAYSHKRGRALDDIFPPDEYPPTLPSIQRKLIEAANVIIDHKIAIATGLETNNNAIYYSGPEVDYIMDMVKPLLKQQEITKQMKIKSFANIMEQVKVGNLSPKEGREYAQLLEKQAQVEMLELLG